ncbi:MAG: hypothetical protein JWR41_2539 [Modestobacter sp.]|nr:hypothetical protein [Modestobacter sp.]
MGGVFLTSTTGGAQLDLGAGNILVFAVAAAVIGGTSRSAAALPPSYQNVITGAVLLIAAGIDALSRRRSATRRS